MAEPTSTTTLAVAATGLGFASLLPGVDGNALIGAFAGATLFVMSAKELTTLYRMGYLLISLIMGYMAAPEITAHTFIEQTGVAAFIAGLLCVTFALFVMEKLKELDLQTIVGWTKK